MCSTCPEKEGESKEGEKASSCFQSDTVPCLPGGNVAAFQTRSISNLYSTAARPSYSLEKEARGVFAGAGKLIPAVAKPSPAPAAAWYLPGFFRGFQQRGEQLLQDHHLLLQQQLAVQGLLQGSEAESGGPMGAPWGSGCPQVWQLVCVLSWQC